MNEIQSEKNVKNIQISKDLKISGYLSLLLKNWTFLYRSACKYMMVRPSYDMLPRAGGQAGRMQSL